MRIVLLALALTMAAPAAFPAPPNSREEALAALASADAATRAEAVVWIANRGGPADDGLLHERLRDESAFVRSYAEQGLWLLWSRSGDAEIDRVMARGVEHMQAGRHAEALATFSSVIARRPEFAEAWNKRATVHYLAGDYRRSLADCDEVLKRNPRHFGALSGKGMVHVALEQYEQARGSFRRALEVNPNMVGVELELLRLEERLKAKRKLST
ncbi:MAG TPA: tetratricopeptide repeat protein [Burkholderiales bacterium]